MGKVSAVTGRARGELSRFLSWGLRHEPEEAGLVLDDEGWCSVESAAAAASRHLRRPVSPSEIEGLARDELAPGEKRRFELSGGLVRAGHGHSRAVAGLRPTSPTGPLWHATTADAVPAIRAAGLRAMARQKVHLAYDRDITVEAARRRGPDVVLIEVDAPAAAAAGIGFYESADPRIVLSDAVPAHFLRFPAD